MENKELKEIINSEGHSLIFGVTGSGKTSFLNQNIFQLLNKKIIITKELDFFCNSKNNFKLYNYSQINFQYYFTDEELINYLSIHIKKDISISKIFSLIISEIKKKTKLKFFNDIFSFYLNNKILFLDYTLEEMDEIKSIFEHFLLLDHKVDLYEIIFSESDIIIYTEKDFYSENNLKIILKLNFINKVNIVIDDIYISNKIEIIDKNIKLFIIKQDIKEDNLEMYSKIFIFQSTIGHLSINKLNQYNLNYLSPKDIGLLNVGEFFYLNKIKNTTIKYISINNYDNKLFKYLKIFLKNRKILKEEINLNQYYGFFKKLIDSKKIISIQKEDYKFTIRDENIDFIFNLNMNNLYLKKVFFYNIYKTINYDLKIMEKHVFSYFKNKYFFVEKDESNEILKILLY